MTTMVQHAFQSSSGMPADNIVNTFHFETEGPLSEAVGEELALLVHRFYDVAAGGELAVGAYLHAAAFGPTRHLTKVYSLADAKPRPPRAVVTANTGPSPAAYGLPSEVAACLSYRGSTGPGLNMKRRRGRIYVGPLNNEAMGNIVGVGIGLAPAFQEAMLAAAIRLKSEALTAGSTWVVYSGTSFEEWVPGGGNFGGVDITDFWVDNAFDTIRSRGPKATARLTASVV